MQELSPRIFHRTEPYLYGEMDYITDHQLDTLLSDGWRHFGSFFFRQRQSIHEGEPVQVQPVRIRLADYKHKKRHRKLLRKQSDTRVIFAPAEIDAHKIWLFEQHKTRFSEHTPKTIYDFLSKQPAIAPTRIVECQLWDDDYCYAVSFLDVGAKCTSSVYAMFDLEYSDRSPGIHTLLAEIDYSIRQQKEFLYLGYTYDQPSFYDYKKRFPALEYYDWQGDWRPLETS